MSNNLEVVAAQLEQLGLGGQSPLDPAMSVNYVPPPLTDDETSAQLTEQYLLPSEQLPWDLLNELQSVPLLPYPQVFNALLTTPDPLRRTQTRFKRLGIDGRVSGFEEVAVADLGGVADGGAVARQTAVNSMSMARKVGEKSNTLRGKTLFLPFTPGGFTMAPLLNTGLAHLSRDTEGLYNHPPGLSRGLQLAEKVEEMNSIDNPEEDLAPEEPSREEVPADDVEDFADELDPAAVDGGEEGNSIEDFIPTDVTLRRVATLDAARVRTSSAKETRLWAHVVDLDHRLENFKELIPNMAREWPFELDTFQQEAVYHLEQGDSVFVAAHTSAGKTVVAEYAIAMANRNMTKAIYTLPIKALLNQKFRDFKETFKEVDVGLITGDVQINPEANCLIMTTEILRSMLYRGADLIRDVEFVIFDEVHYVNDIERGVVWEEVIIMLPDHVKFILLSATVPNTYEFANWVGRTKQKDIYVISTPKRPVPLEIYAWAKNDLFKLVDSLRKFSEQEFRKMKEVYVKPIPAGGDAGRGGAARGGGARGGGARGRGGTERGGARGRGGADRGRGGAGRGGPSRGPTAAARYGQRDGPNKSSWLNLVQFLKKQLLLPAVIFVFSKKRCEEYVETLSLVEFLNGREKLEVHMFIDRVAQRLKREDRELPQIMKVREMAGRGIAVHHGGLLPIVKECIEILFARGLVRVLFATETFAMGLNLPTRTVVFSELRKHDGRGFRNLLPGEFTQMLGRAGRRGLDKTGTVIVMTYNQPLEAGPFKEVTLGVPTKLSLQFRLTYNMILNLLRIEALRVEEMIKRLFLENSAQVLLPEHQQKIAAYEQQLASLEVDGCDYCSQVMQAEDGASGSPERLWEEVHHRVMRYKTTTSQILTEAAKTPILFNQLKLGRMLFYKNKGGVLAPGFVMRGDGTAREFYVLTASMRGPARKGNRTDVAFIPQIGGWTERFFCTIEEMSKFYVDKVLFDDVEFVTLLRLSTSMNHILAKKPGAREEALEQIQLLLKYQNLLPEFDWGKLANLQLHELVAAKGKLVDGLVDLQEVWLCPQFPHHFAQLHLRHLVKEQISTLQLLINDENLELLPDYHQRLVVLEELGFVDKHLNVVLKGRVACEINLGWELVMTELVLDNFLGDFEPEEIVALLLAFVYEGRTRDEEDPPMTPRLERGKTRILDIVERMLGVYSECQVALSSEEEQFMESKRFALMNVVYEWARGMLFKDIMQLSGEAEGTIVRVITRLDEVCREVKLAAMIIGDMLLHLKMTEAQEMIKRDIVFCASLYL